MNIVLNNSYNPYFTSTKNQDTSLPERKEGLTPDNKKTTTYTFPDGEEYYFERNDEGDITLVSRKEAGEDIPTVSIYEYDKKDKSTYKEYFTRSNGEKYISDYVKGKETHRDRVDDNGDVLYTSKKEPYIDEKDKYRIKERRVFSTTRPEYAEFVALQNLANK